MPGFLRPCASDQGPARHLVGEETRARRLTVRQGSGTRPCRVGSQRRAAVAPSHAGLCIARGGHGVVQSEARSRSIGITRSGASSGVTVIDLRIRSWVYEQRRCCLVFLIRAARCFIRDRGTIGIKFPSEHDM
jgi:hypothetical protein